MTSKDFIFNEKRLSDFGLVMADTGTSDDIGLARDILKGDMTANRYEANHYGTAYNGVSVLNFFILKRPCGVELPSFTRHELREVERWLTANNLPIPLRLVCRDGSEIEYQGIFTDISPYTYKGLNGLNLVFTCDSPFSYLRSKQKFTITDNTKPTLKNLHNDTDEYSNDDVFPIIKYRPKSNKVLKIVHKQDNKSMDITFPEIYKEVIIDCKLKRIIADGNPLSLIDVGMKPKELLDHNNIGTGVFQVYWLTLHQGQNKVSFEGNGSYEIDYKSPQKLGGYVDV